MRRLSKQLAIFTLALLVGVILTVCSLATLIHNSEMNTNVSSVKDCSSSCSSHTQSATIGGLKDEKSTDDKEPAPPFSYWLRTPVLLTTLYMSLIAYVMYVNKRKILLLIGQLRF